MPKKTCIPGLFCIENVSFFLLFLLLLIVIYLYYVNLTSQSSKKSFQEKVVQPVIVMAPPLAQYNTSLLPQPSNPLTSDFAPPLKNMQPTYSKGIPINMKTRGMEQEYNQVGILTRNSGKEEILPLMGRKAVSARDKFQYYTMTNTAGNINTKLPVSVNGKSCTSEIGCDEIHNGDTVYVEGYNNTFKATIYENSLYRYIPFV